MFSAPRVTLLVLTVWLTCYTLAVAQSRLIGDTYTFSGTNFDGNIGVTIDPVESRCNSRSRYVPGDVDDRWCGRSGWGNARE